jgi:hypothetical protein
LRRIRERFTYANVMSTLAVFLVLISGTAYASHLIVRSSDVVDESMLSADLRNGSAVKGSDVVNDSLEGADIKEGTLGQVGAATLGGLGRSAADGFCDPEANTFVRCVQVQLDLTRPARVLLNGRIRAVKEQGSTQPSIPQCRWGGVIESGPMLITPDHNGEDVPLVGVSNIISPGQGYTFAIECDDPGGTTYFEDAWVTATAISPA